MRYSLRQLEIFTAAARHGSLSAAADELAMSQSAASTALIELERRYGRPLFDRAGKRLRINETGRSLLSPALELLSRAVEIDAILAGRTGPGPLRLGATQTIGNYVVPRLLDAYAQQHPGCDLSLEIDNTAHIAGKIADFSLDLALVEGEYAHPDLTVADWLADELVLLCSPSHRLAERKRCGIDDVLAERWVVREQGSGTRHTLDRAMQPWWSRWAIGLELQQIEAILEMVAVSSMIGCVSRVAAQRSLDEGRIVELTCPEIDLHRRFYIMTHREKHITAGMRAFLDIAA
jgi:DNA-binding transcriptional LysR family regulator